MSDTIDDFRAINTASAIDRKLRREIAHKVLSEDKDIAFSSHNEGAHLIVVGRSNSVDFWPGTDKWHSRDKRIKGYGLDNMLKFVKTGNKE